MSAIPQGNVDLDELVESSRQSMVLYNKMVARVDKWLDQIDDSTVTPTQVFKAYSLIAPILLSIAVIRGKVAEQRQDEAQDIKPPTTGDERDSPRIAETLRLMRDRFSEIRAKTQ